MLYHIKFDSFDSEHHAHHAFLWAFPIDYFGMKNYTISLCIDEKLTNNIVGGPFKNGDYHTWIKDLYNPLKLV